MLHLSIAIKDFRWSYLLNRGFVALVYGKVNAAIDLVNVMGPMKAMHANLGNVVHTEISMKEGLSFKRLGASVMDAQCRGQRLGCQRKCVGEEEGEGPESTSRSRIGKVQDSL